MRAKTRLGEIGASVFILMAILLAVLPPAAHATSYTVTTLADDGPGSLRQAIIDANAGAYTISFDVSGTITLASTLPAITDADGLTIDGTGQTVTISGNNAVRVMQVSSGASLTLNNLTIADGHSSSGGIFNNGGTVTITNSTFSGNSGINYGGGIFNKGGTATITNSTFSGNSASSGGGIYNDGTVTITNSTFSGNSAGTDGGGIFNGGTVTITNGTFSGNSAGTDGGAISSLGSGALLTVTNSTVSANSAATSAGGIHSTGTVIFRNSIVANNTAAVAVNCHGNAITNGGNNIDDGTSCGWGSWNGSKSSTDPLLGPLADNGGPTQTMALLTDSPAIDGVTYNSPNSAPASDQRGVARPQGSGRDIGAFEMRTYDINLTQNCLLVNCVPKPVGETNDSVCTIVPASGNHISNIAAGNTGYFLVNIDPTWVYTFENVTHEKDFDVTCVANNIRLFRGSDLLGNTFDTIQEALDFGGILSNDQILVPAGAYVEAGHTLTLNRTDNKTFTLSGGWDSGFNSNAGEVSQIAGKLVIEGTGGLIIDGIEIL